MRSTCRLPFAGATNRSTRSVKVIRPARSLLKSAAKLMSATTSAAVPRRPASGNAAYCEAERSTAQRTASSRSSTYSFTQGSPRRAVTFQSMKRTSSPGMYSRTSANSIPVPRNTER